MPGTARIGPIEITGLLGHTRTVSAAAMASSTPGAGEAVVGAVEAHADDRGSQRSRTNHSCIGRARRRSVVIRVATRSSVIGSSRGARSHAAVIRAVTSLSGGALAEEPGAEQVGGEVAVAEAEPGVLAVAVERVDGDEGLAGQPPAGVGVLGPGQGVGDASRGRGRRRGRGTSRRRRC